MAIHPARPPKNTEELRRDCAPAKNRVESDIRFFMGHPQAMIGSDGNAISPDGLYKNF